MKCVKRYMCKCPADVVKTDTMEIQLFSIRNSHNIKNPPIRIASAHIHTPRNNPAKFHDNPMDSLGGVVDKGPYICMCKKWLRGNPPPKKIN